MGLVGAVLALAVPASALRRVPRTGPYFNRLVVSGYAGSGLTVGEFASSRPGDGNHKSGAVGYAVDVEMFFVPGVSIGATMAGHTFEDRSDPSLETNLTTFAGFLRYVAYTGDVVRPFLRIGLGGQRVQFQDRVNRFRSDFATYVQGGAGVIFRVSNSFSLDGQALYNYGFTENAYVPDADAIVGFDTKYWTLSGGVSLYFP